MKTTNVLFPSPTLALFEKELKNGSFCELSKRITDTCTLYRSTVANIQITAITDKPDRPGVLDTLHPIVINLQELPDELRQGLHNYATRLIGEKHQLKAQSLIEKL